MPLSMRLPKLRGFKSHAPKSELIYTGQLDAIKKSGLDSVALFEAGLISNPHVRIKLLVKGELAGKKDLKIPAASAAAIKAVDRAGGSVTITERLARQPKQKTAK